MPVCVGERYTAKIDKGDTKTDRQIETDRQSETS